jgi:hypothetical protein
MNKSRLWINAVPMSFRVKDAEGVTRTFSAGSGKKESEAKAEALAYAEQVGGTFSAVPQGVALCKLEGQENSSRISLAAIPSLNPAYGQSYVVEYDSLTEVGKYVAINNLKFVVEAQAPHATPAEETVSAPNTGEAADPEQPF